MQILRKEYKIIILRGNIDVEGKSNKVRIIYETIIWTFKDKVKKYTEMKMCNVMPEPTLLYENEIWIPTHEDQNKLQFSEMKFLRSAKSCLIL